MLYAWDAAIAWPTVINSVNLHTDICVYTFFIRVVVHWRVVRWGRVSSYTTIPSIEIPIPIARLSHVDDYVYILVEVNDKHEFLINVYILGLSHAIYYVLSMWNVLQNTSAGLLLSSSLIKGYGSKLSSNTHYPNSIAKTGSDAATPSGNIWVSSPP